MRLMVKDFTKQGPVDVRLFDVTISTPGWFRVYRCHYRLVDGGVISPNKVINIYTSKQDWR